MDADVDDRLLLDREGPGAATAFRTRNHHVAIVGRSAAGMPVFAGPSFMTRYEQALIWSGMKSLICLPIYGDTEEWMSEPGQRPECVAALSLDSDDDLSEDWNDQLRDWTIEKSVALGKGIDLKELGRVEQ